MSFKYLEICKRGDVWEVRDQNGNLLKTARTQWQAEYYAMKHSPGITISAG
jgi:hypothetical protein